MRIVGALWTPHYNLLAIECSKGHLFEHRSDRWQVQCPQCRERQNLSLLRKNYVKEQRNADS